MLIVTERKIKREGTSNYYADRSDIHGPGPCTSNMVHIFHILSIGKYLATATVPIPFWFFDYNT